MSAMSTCDACGWAAAVGGMLAFGTFGVPIKSKVAQTVDIDPLVMQTYKTTMCFLTSWFVLLYGEELNFTPWGIVSGLFWVPGGVATVFAVKNAGLAIGIGVGSSFIVLVSFTWGIFVFGEHVHSVSGACFAVSCMMMGLLGMAYYSVPPKLPPIIDDDDNHEATAMTVEHGAAYRGLPESLSDDEAVENLQVVVSNDDGNFHHRTSAGPLEGVDPDEIVSVVNGNDNGSDELHPPLLDQHILICGRKWNRRTLGIMSAMFTGIYGGSIMAPMKWAPDDAKGLGYLISFSIGASTVNICLWIFRFLYHCKIQGSPSLAYQALPSFHLRKMWLYGGTCGLLWSIGNFFSMISVDFLGEGVGYSVVQASMLVSGLWGIFYFKEVQGTETILKWFSAAFLTVLGILLLSYEHHEK